MHPKLHVRFGGRAGETHQLKSRKGAPVRPLHLCSDLVGLRVCGVGDRCLLAVRRRMASIQQRTNRPGSRRSRTSNLGPATGHSRPRPEAGSSLRRRQPIPVHPLHQPADGSRHLTVGRISRRLPATTPSRSPSSASTRQNSSEPRGRWRDRDQVEYATLEYVDWFNHRRLLEPIGNIPPAEREDNYHRDQN